ncbi:MAG TPA: ATP-binding cassette domain-containing protein [Candidatus Methylomirabilis sp.]|nr:ATP-binding cassette domain-containing protein [Candidatus Methylomirabilis sp.]
MLELAFEYRLEDFHLAPALATGRDVTALYGPSGAGKSLTLLCLVGLRRPTRGYIRLNGRMLFDASAGVHLPPHSRRVGLVFQEYALFPHLSVASNLAYGLGGLTRSEMQERVQAMLRLLRLDALGDRYPGELSGGQRQRVALGRGLIIQPELLLLDEPFSALDQMERERLRSEVLELLQGFGGTTILVTHNLQEAYLMARQIAVIDSGRILQTGARDEVLQHPRTRRVAEHVGITNIFQGTVADAGAGRPTIAWYGEQLTCLTSLPPGGSVEFCIRPEDVRLVWPEKAAERPNVLRGHLTAEVERGVDYLLRFRADGRAIEAGEIEIHCSEHLHYLMKLHPGKHVVIALPPDKLHILTPADER